MRRLVLLGLLLALGACGALDRRAAERATTPPARFAETLLAADPMVDAAIGRMEGFEQRAAREDQAVAFALGRPAPPPGTGAVEAAGAVLGPAFTALGDYAEVLGQAAMGEPPASRPSPGAEALAAMVAEALPATRAAPAVREAGLAGIAALARLAEGAEARRGLAAETLAREAAPHLAAVAALLRSVVGEGPAQGARAAIAAERRRLDEAQARLMAAIRADRSLGPAARYALFHQLMAQRDDDPLPGTLGAIDALLARMAEAHAAIAAGSPEAAARVGGFEAALADLGALAGMAAE